MSARRAPFQARRSVDGYELVFSWWGKGRIDVVLAEPLRGPIARLNVWSIEERAPIIPREQGAFERYCDAALPLLC